MKQILQDLTSGVSQIKEAPIPQCGKNTLLVATNVSLISPGTERMLIEFSKSSYLQKIRQQPEKAKMVLAKIKSNGLLATIDAVRSKLAQPLPLGYCNVAKILEVGDDVTGFKVGDRIISNGPHADIACVGQNLCAKIPDNVDDETAVFTVVASIGLQGIRLAQPTLGESFAVIGVGLIGLLVVQLLRAHGCRVLAIDFDEKKLALAAEFGAEICNPGSGEEPINAGLRFSRWHGVDGVIITASTSSSDPISQSAKMSRKRGRIVLIGTSGLELNRADFYEKELSFQVSCSYGPGRYDEVYERQGLDYPIGFVRWTEQRNFEAILDLMQAGKLDIKPLITYRYAFEEAEAAYQTLTEDRAALGILLQYNSVYAERDKKVIRLCEDICFDAKKPILGFIGAGNYAARQLIPAFKKARAQFHTIISSGGINAVIHGEKAGFTIASTDLDTIFNCKDINMVVIATRHDTHAKMVVKAITLGKHVFVEKPLAINLKELADIEVAYQTAHLMDKKVQMMVGFNRRFAPHIKKIKELLQPIKEPKSLIMTINAGEIDAGHWTQDIMIGGGRIVGEACHFIDLMRHLVGHEITSVQAWRMGKGLGIENVEDKATITLGFADGSFGSIHYFANGAVSFPKERVEIFCSGRVLQLDNFRKLKGFSWPGFKSMNLWKQDKGQTACTNAFLQAIENGTESPIHATEIFEIASISIKVAEMLRRQ